MGVSLILVATGASLVWAVDTNAEGLNVNTIGWILIVVGAVGALLSLVFWTSWAGDTVVREQGRS